MLAGFEGPAAVRNSRLAVLGVCKCRFHNDVDRRCLDDHLIVGFRATPRKPAKTAPCEIRFNECLGVKPVGRNYGTEIKVADSNDVQAEAEIPFPQRVLRRDQFGQRAVDATKSDQSNVVDFHVVPSGEAICAHIIRCGSLSRNGTNRPICRAFCSFSCRLAACRPSRSSTRTDNMIRGTLICFRRIRKNGSCVSARVTPCRRGDQTPSGESIKVDRKPTRITAAALSH